jgi:hypothetical protein
MNIVLFTAKAKRSDHHQKIFLAFSDDNPKSFCKHFYILTTYFLILSNK